MSSQRSRKPDSRQNNNDRTHFVPKHTGPNILPNTPFFTQLLRHAHKNRLAIRDVNLNCEKTYGDLLSDSLALREQVSKKLSKGTLQVIEDEEEVFIGVMAPGGYEYAVGILAVMALGAAPVPMTTALPVEEAAYFVSASRQVAVLIQSDMTPHAQAFTEYAYQNPPANSPPPELAQAIPILPNLATSEQSLSPRQILISSNQYLSDNSAGLCIFTSGTTGPPKGAIIRRGYIHDASRSVAEHFELNPRDVMLHVLPVHHVTGIAITLLPFLISGAAIEFRSGSFDAQWTWERWKRGGLTFFSGVPTIFMRMMRYYQQYISKTKEAEKRVYDEGARAFRAIICGTSALPKPLQDFWTELRGGKVILTRYGSTEVAAVFKVPMEPGDTPDGSVGKLVPGVDVRLSEGDEGEVLVKSPYLFSKYLFDDKATAESHNEEGYFKTGDIARKDEQGHYFIVGRASQDIIKSGGYKISALDIERELLGLPYIGEAMVVGVDDLEFGQRVGAAVTLREDQEEYDVGGKQKKLTIDDVRRDLGNRLAGYKQPTLLRVMENELPKTASGKVQKKILGPELFPSPGWEKHPEVQAWKQQTKSKL